MTIAPLTRNDIINAVCNRNDYPKSMATKIIEDAVHEIAARVLAGNAVRLHGFGTFVLHERPARTGRNPQAGEKIEIPARREVKFRPAKDLKARAEGA